MPEKETKDIVRMVLNCKVKSTENKTFDPALYVGEFEALASTFGNLDHYNDIIQQGAFKPALKLVKKTGEMPKSLIQHDYRNTGAIYTEIKEIEEGLWVKGFFINTSKGRDLHIEAKTGATNKMSIGFRVGKSEIDEEAGIRTITEIAELPEISFVTFPANPKADVLDVKNKPMNERELETALKDIGFSQRESKTIVSKGFKSLNHRDDEDAQRDAEELKEMVVEFNKNIERNIK